MPSSRLQWRALAVLGALLLVIFLWPLTCAAMPKPIRHVESLSNIMKTKPVELKSEPTLGRSNNVRNMSVANVTKSENMSQRTSDYLMFMRAVREDRKSASAVDTVNEAITKKYLLHSQRKARKPYKRRIMGPAQITSDILKTIKEGHTTPSSSPPTSPSTAHASELHFVDGTESSSQSFTSGDNNTIYNRLKSSVIDQNDLFNLDSVLVRSTKFSNDPNWTTTPLSIEQPNYLGGNYQNFVNNSKYNLVLSRTDRSVFHNGTRRRGRKGRESNLDRNERSANLSHITGSARKIQLYIKNRYLQILPDGTINGTQDDLSDYTILQRTTVDIGKIKIQGVATCMFLCMDTCGSVYGSKEFTDDCIFNEAMEEHHYNTYSSSYHSNSRRILYLALNRHGQPRKIQIPASRTLGKLATYTKSLTQTVEQHKVEQVIARLFGSNHVKHGLKQLCDSGKSLIDLTAKVMKLKPKCNSKKKKRKKKRKCKEDEAESEICFKPTPISVLTSGGPTATNKKKSSPGNQKQQNPKCADEVTCSPTQIMKKKNNKKNHKVPGDPQNPQNSPNLNNKKPKQIGGGPPPNRQRPNKLDQAKQAPTTERLIPTTDDDLDIDLDTEDIIINSSTELHDDTDLDEISTSPSLGRNSSIENEFEQ